MLLDVYEENARLKDEVVKAKAVAKGNILFELSSVLLCC